MFWKAELERLARHKQALTADCDLARACVTQQMEELAHRLAWLETTQTWIHRAQPLLLVAAPLAGLFLGKRLPRLARWSTFATPLFRLARTFLQLQRATSPGSSSSRTRST